MAPWQGRWTQKDSWDNHKSGGWSKSGGGHSQGNQQRKGWSCQDKNCCSAMAKAGRQPRVNAASATSCDVCGVHWNRGAQKEQEELALLRKEVRAAQPTPPTNKGSYAAVAAGKVAVAVNKTPKDAVSLDSEE